MDKQTLLQQLDTVEEIANLSKAGRLLRMPGRYLDAIVFWKFIYPRNKKQRTTLATLFFGKKMHIALPASTDIYLTGGKSHLSEIKLARFIINELNPGNQFLDIGAHYGYFSILAAEMVGKTGKVASYEPAGAAYELLSRNAADLYPGLIHHHREAVSDTPGTLTFFEFPNLYSEYNSMDTQQFSKEKWYKENKPREITVQAKTIDDITGPAFSPAIIKIDVEGAEDKVMMGGGRYLTDSNPWIVMEYLSNERGNSAHVEADHLLRSMGYKSHVLNEKGYPIANDDINGYMAKYKLDSDNIVYRKPVTK